MNHVPEHLKQCPGELDVPEHLRHCATETIPGSAFTQHPTYPPEEQRMLDQRDSRGVRVLTYLACPYSHPLLAVEEWRYEQATKAASHLIKLFGWNVFSPITHSHPLRVLGDCAGSWKFWEQIDREYLSVSRRLVVLCIAGWKESVGVAAEVKIADEQGIPVQYLVWARGGWLITNRPSDFPTLDIPIADEPPACSEPLSPNQPALVPAGMPNPKDLIGMTKPPLRLVPAALLLYVSRVMGLGAKKYGPYNWRQHAVRYCVYLEAAMRHILAALDGEENDPESGQPHTAHAAACMGIILDAKAIGKLLDDRPIPGAASKLIAEMTEKKT